MEGRHRDRTASKGWAGPPAGVDLAAHTAEVHELRARVEQLEEDLEDAGMALLLQERLATTSGQRLTTEQFLTGIGWKARSSRSGNADADPADAGLRPTGEARSRQAEPR
jgi:hypothetical protein